MFWVKPTFNGSSFFNIKFPWVTQIMWLPPEALGRRYFEKLSCILQSIPIKNINHKIVRPVSSNQVFLKFVCLCKKIKQRKVEKKTLTIYMNKFNTMSSKSRSISPFIWFGLYWCLVTSWTPPGHALHYSCFFKNKLVNFFFSGMWRWHVLSLSVLQVYLWFSDQIKQLCLIFFLLWTTVSSDVTGADFVSGLCMFIFVVKW